jgi:hypothetical protein
MALLLAFGASLIEPHEISNLTDAIAAIGCRLRLRLAACAAFRWGVGGVLASAQ